MAEDDRRKAFERYIRLRPLRGRKLKRL
jgi:hypothetical protein